jgi:acetyltransferase
LIWIEKRGIHINKAISVGNEANVDITDCLEYFREDEGTKVLGMYIEGIKKEGRKFVDALRSITKTKPVIVSYHGGTTAGARAGMSHTASLGGKPSVYDSIFKQSGVIKAANMEELFEYSYCFSLAHPPKGNRVGLITNSGGPAVTLADLCERENLVVPAFSSELQNKLKEVIPRVASPNNPIDLTFDLNIPLFYEEVPRLIWESGEVDSLIMYGIFDDTMLRRSIRYSGGELEEIFPFEAMSLIMNETLGNFCKWVHENKIPVLISCIDTADNVVELLNTNDIPVFIWPGMTVKAMKALVQYYQK